MKALMVQTALLKYKKDAPSFVDGASFLYFNSAICTIKAFFLYRQ